MHCPACGHPTLSRQTDRYPYQPPQSWYFCPDCYAQFAYDDPTTQSPIDAAIMRMQGLAHRLQEITCITMGSGPNEQPGEHVYRDCPRPELILYLFTPDARMWCRAWRD